MIDDDIRNAEQMTEEDAWKWCGDRAFQSLCEDTAENIVDNLPEELQNQVLAWAEDRLFGALYQEGKIKEREEE